MFAFKHHLKRSPMDAIIFFLSTVPPAAPATLNRPFKEKQNER